jgi:hypothetical protein
MQMTEIQIVSGSQEEVSAVIEGECDLLVPRKLPNQLDRAFLLTAIAILLKEASKHFRVGYRWRDPTIP